MTEEEKIWLERISRSQSEPAVHVAHAKEILEVAAGRSYTEAAQLAGKESGDSVSHLVERFNQEGMQANDTLRRVARNHAHHFGQRAYKDFHGVFLYLWRPN